LFDLALLRFNENSKFIYIHCIFILLILSACSKGSIRQRTYTKQKLDELLQLSDTSNMTSELQVQYKLRIELQKYFSKEKITEDYVPIDLRADYQPGYFITCKTSLRNMRTFRKQKI
jgi:hypothetical protein